MSKRMSLSLTVACPSCGAAAGQRCRTKKGGEATDSHAARVELVNPVVRL